MESRCASVYFSHADPCEGNQRALLITADAAELLNPTCHSSSVPSSANCRVPLLHPSLPLRGAVQNPPLTDTAAWRCLSLSLSLPPKSEIWISLNWRAPPPPTPQHHSLFLLLVSEKSVCTSDLSSFSSCSLYVWVILVPSLFWGDSSHDATVSADSRSAEPINLPELLLLAWSFKFLCKSSVVFSFIDTSGLKVSQFYEQ